MGTRKFQKLDEMNLEDQVFENLLLRGKIAKLEEKLKEAELRDKEKTEKIRKLEDKVTSLIVKLSSCGGYRVRNEERTAKVRAKYGLVTKPQVNPVKKPKKSLLSRLLNKAA